MQLDATARRRTVAAATFLGLTALTLAMTRAPAGRAAFVPRPPARELRDLAVDCLAAGSVRPAVSELGEGEFEAIVEILARMIGAYGRADFDSFLALHAGDLESAAERRADDVPALREFGRELSIPEAELRGDWIATLGVFWRAYYARPPVARFLPELTRIELHAEGVGTRRLASWQRSFEALRDRDPGSWIQHELSVPHRRALEQVMRAAGPLRWLDLELAFETQAGLGARLVVRFVWDGVTREWFLHEAASVHVGADRSERQLIL